VRRKNNESGAILAIVIILMFALTITGLAFLSSTVMEHNLAMREVHKTQAFYLAEAGVEDARFKLGQDWGLVEDYNGGPKESPPIIGALEAGTYNVTIYNTESDNVTGLSSDRRRVNSIGAVKNVSQIVQVIVRKPPSGANIVSALESGGNVRVTGNATITGEPPNIAGVISKTLAESVVTGSGEVFGDIIKKDPSSFEGDFPGEGEYEDYFEYIFEMTRGEMKDLAKKNGNKYYPTPIKNADVEGITWIDDPNQEGFEVTRTDWEGQGILIVNGDMKIVGGTFEGIIWVTGALTIPKGNPVIKGAVFVEGEIMVDTPDVVGGTVNLEYDSDAIDTGLGKIATLPRVVFWEQLK